MKISQFLWKIYAWHTPHYEKVPFEVQESWEWSNVESFTYDLQYGTSEKSSNEGDVPVLRMGNISRIGTIDFTDLVYSSNKDDIIKYALLKDDLLFNRTNSSEWVGKTAIFKSDSPAIYAGYLIRVRCILVCPDYINFVLNSSYHREWCNSIKTDAVNQSNINAQKLSKHLIPIPPYEEQLRIVAETKKWMSVIDKMEGDVSELDQVINTIKSKILDLAIHGKLVPQDPNDEPAIELLKRINPKFTPCDNAHYENVPSNWALSRVEDIGQLLSGRDLTNDECNSENMGLPYLIGASNIEGDTFSFIRWTEKPQVISQIGDILISCKGTIGTIVKNDIGDMHIARQFMAIRPNTNCITSDYLHICLIAAIEEIKKDARGVIPGISRDDILTKVFTIPPLNEQCRIVAAIQEYYEILDNISANL